MNIKEFLAQPIVQAYVIASAVLILKMFYVANRTALARAKSKVFPNAEDAVFNKTEQAPQEHPDVARGLKVHRNDLENIVPFFAAGWIYILAGASATAGFVYFGIFTLSRISHTICYFGGKQPWRTASFAAGAIITIVMTIHAVVALFL